MIDSAAFLVRFVFVGLAIFRLAQLIVYDDGPWYVCKRLRQAVGIRAAHSARWKHLADLLGCPYCVGMWLALAGLGVLVYVRSLVVDYLVIWLALAGLQAYLQDKESDQ